MAESVERSCRGSSTATSLCKQMKQIICCADELFTGAGFFAMPIMAALCGTQCCANDFDMTAFLILCLHLCWPLGLAMSQDGRNWARIEGDHHSGALFDVGAPGEWDELFVGQPQVGQVYAMLVYVVWECMRISTQPSCLAVPNQHTGLPGLTCNCWYALEDIKHCVQWGRVSVPFWHTEAGGQCGVLHGRLHGCLECCMGGYRTLLTACSPEDGGTAYRHQHVSLSHLVGQTHT
jgi:hypothetical protein